MEFFRIEELVDKFTFEKLGANAIWMLNSNAVANLIKLRKAIGKPITVNNYHLGGNLSNRGYRSIYSTTGAKFSQHRVGNGFDINVKGMEVSEVNEFIFDNYASFGITTIESIKYAPTWTHIDFRTTNQKELKIVKP